MFLSQLLTAEMDNKINVTNRSVILSLVSAVIIPFPGHHTHPRNEAST